MQKSMKLQSKGSWLVPSRSLMPTLPKQQEESNMFDSVVSEFMGEPILQQLQPKLPPTNQQCPQPLPDAVEHHGNEWTEAEGQTLFELFIKWGSKWTKVSHAIKGKTQNCVKNRFYGCIRKMLRKVNRAAKVLPKRFKKQIKYESIIRIIDASEGLFRLDEDLKSQSESLSRKILVLAEKAEEDIPSKQAEQLILEINKFNMATRSYKSIRKIKNHEPIKQAKLDSSLNLKKSSETCSSRRGQLPSSLPSSQLPLSQPSQSLCPPKIYFELPSLKSQEQLPKIKEEQNEGVQKMKLIEDRLDIVSMVESIEQLFTEVHSPLDFQLWM